MNKIYPKTDLGFERGHPFIMAWVYLPTGPQVFTGSLGKIREHLKDSPTCHGFFRYFMNKRVHRVRHAEIFGKRSWINYRKNRDMGVRNHLHLAHYSQRDLQNTDMFKHLRPFLDPKRRLWILTEETETGTKLLGKWRKLPATYLRALKDCEPVEC